MHQIYRFATKWCHYCRQFYPLWARLIERNVGRKINFYFIDCIPAREFCATKNAIGFPTLSIYGDGKFIIEYVGDENINELQAFTNRYFAEYEAKKKQ